MGASALPVEISFGLTSAREARRRLRVGEVAAFFLGLTTWIEVQILGRMFIGELGLALCALALPVLWSRLRRAEERRILTWFVVLFGAYLAGLVLTDLYRGTAFSDYARGWARALFFFTNTIGLIVIGYSKPRQLLAWLAGQVVSGLVPAAFEYVQYSRVDWKFGLALPVTVGVLLMTNSRRTGWTYVVLLALGMINLLSDYRSLAAFCCATAVLLYYKANRARVSGSRLILATGVITTVIGVGFLALYSSGALVGDPTFGRDVFERRRGSNIERLAGLLIGVQAVRASPLVGYGSWARSSDLFDNWALIQEEMGSTVTAAERVSVREERGELDVIPTHSQLLQGWVEAGIPGLVFFLFILTTVIRLMKTAVRSPIPDPSFALVALWGIWVVWALLLSPFGGFARLYNAIGFALLFVFAFRLEPIKGIRATGGGGGR